MAHSSNGNTKHSRRRVRNWCFTLNNYTEADIKMLTNITECKYLFGKEVGEKKGTEHLQGFLCFKNPRTLIGLKRINERIHWEEMRGNIDQSIIYCTKQAKNEDIYTNIDNWEKVAQGTGTLSIDKKDFKKIDFEKKLREDIQKNMIEFIESEEFKKWEFNEKLDQ